MRVAMCVSGGCEDKMGLALWIIDLRCNYFGSIFADFPSRKSRTVISHHCR